MALFHFKELAIPDCGTESRRDVSFIRAESRRPVTRRLSRIRSSDGQSHLDDLGAGDQVVDAAPLLAEDEQDVYEREAVRERDRRNNPDRQQSQTDQFSKRENLVGFIVCLL